MDLVVRSASMVIEFFGCFSGHAGFGGSVELIGVHYGYLFRSSPIWICTVCLGSLCFGF